MGVLADIYVSKKETAIQYDTAPDEFVDRVQYKRITPLELSTLLAILRGSELDVDSVVAAMDEFPCILQEDDSEHLIHQFPVVLVDALSMLATDRISEVSGKWNAAGELNWPADETVSVIADIVRLAQIATGTGRNVYLWNCV